MNNAETLYCDDCGKKMTGSDTKRAMESGEPKCSGCQGVSMTVEKKVKGFENVHDLPADPSARARGVARYGTVKNEGDGEERCLKCGHREKVHGGDTCGACATRGAMPGGTRSGAARHDFVRPEGKK